MGGLPAAIGHAGSAIGDAAKSFYGAGKEALNENYIQPWRHAVSDLKGKPPADPGAAPGAAPAPETNPAMQTFFNAPAVETPAMRNRRMMSQQG